METIPNPLRPLPRNGRIAITSPATTPDPELVKMGISYLEDRGFTVVVGDTCHLTTDYLAGDDARRADELMTFFEDDSIDAVFCSRGGFGSMKILSMLDYYLFREKRKLLIGFSDITALQWALYTEAGLPSISGMMPAIDFCRPDEQRSPEAEQQFWNLVHDGTLDIPLEHTQDQEQTIKGPLLAGTLSVAAKLLGTPYFPGLRDHLLILEDVGEPIHKLEGYLTQFELAGVFHHIKALLTGQFTPAEIEEYPLLPSEDLVFERSIRSLHGPHIQQLPYGHISNKISVPIGVPVSLSLGQTSTLTLEKTLFDT